MTAEQKAKELVIKCYKLKKRPLISFWKDISFAKKCAVLTVDTLLQEGADHPMFRKEFWEQVKQEIEKL